MSKFLKLSIVALILMGLMAGSAFAGTVISASAGINAPSPYLVSLETLGTNRAINLTDAGGVYAANSVPLSYASSQNLTPQNLLQVTFAGAAFNGSVVNVCDFNGATVATGQPAVNATTFNFQLIAGFGSGNYVDFTSDSCGNFTAANLNLLVTPASGSGYGTVSIQTITAGGIVVDPTTTAKIVQILPEYAYNHGAAVHTVDYLSTPFNGTRLLGTTFPVSQLFAETSENDDVSLADPVDGAPNVVETLHDFNVNSGANNASLTAALVVNLTDTASWQGVSQVFLDESFHSGGGFNGTCTDNAGGNTVGTGSPSGTVTLTVPQGVFNGQASEDNALCVVVNGTSTLNTRTINMSEQVLVTGTGANPQPATGLSAVDTWGLNAYQAVIPWLTNTSAVPTYCLINNGNTVPSSIGVTLSVMSSEGTVAGLSSLPVGSIAANQSMLIIFNNNGITNASGTVLASVASMGTDDRYSALITVAGSAPSITVACEQTDPVTGGKRNVPVLGAVGVFTPNF